MEDFKTVSRSEKKVKGHIRSVGVKKGYPISWSLVNFINQSIGHRSDPADLFWLEADDQIPALESVRDYTGIGYPGRLNDIPRINNFLESLNHSLEPGQKVLVCAETKNSRKIRVLNKYPKIISYPYYLLDFILKRVFPKWKPTRKIYYWLTKGRNRVISYTEVLGRLQSCGFSPVNDIRIGYRSYFIAEKTAKPSYDPEPTYGAIIKLKRIGKDGKKFNVYKLRTMHPYSEYIQNYVYKKNDLKTGGKINNDFRITGWGRLFRKYWIDELPMFINYFKGQMKLVGVRPLSDHYFNLYPQDVQLLRTQFKPGLIPPFYADSPQTLEEIVESERTYLESYSKKPVRTDLRYFFRAVYNILIKKDRSN